MSASNQVGAFNYAVPPFGNLQIKNITARYTVSPSDNNFIINCTANSFTVSLQSAASLPIGFNVTIWNTSSGSNDAVTIDPNGVETIDGLTTLILRRSEGMQIVCNGANWDTGNKKTMRGYAENFLASAVRPNASGSGSTAIGNDPGGSGVVASGLNSLAIQGNATAQNCVAIGANSGDGRSQAVTGAAAMALGGSYASGADSFAAAVANNTSTYGAQGANSVAMGKNAKATGGQSLALGNTASASGAGSVAIAAAGTGWGTSATAGSSIAIGDGAVSNIVGKIAFSSGSSNVNTGISQSGLFILSISTTDATASTLNSYNYGTSDSTNQVILPNNSAFSFSGIVVARQKASNGTASAAWKVEGLIRREANAGTTTLVFSTAVAISNVPLWTLALSADTTNGGLAVTATGAAATNIRWVAMIQTSEVTYA
jgi:hypothetical protein